MFLSKTKRQTRFEKFISTLTVFVLSVSFLLSGFLGGWQVTGEKEQIPQAQATTEEYQFVTKWGSQGSGDGQFLSPAGVAVDSSSNVYVADTSSHRIQKFSSNGVYITQWGSYGSGDGQFKYPDGIAVDSSGNVYVADTNNHRIQKFSSNGVYITQWGSYGSSDGQFLYPAGVAVDLSGNVYVANLGNERIEKFDSSGNFITNWGSNGSGDSQFNYPLGIVADSSGNVYVADTNNHRIQKFSSNGTFITKWGTQGTGEGQFDYSDGIAVDSSGNVYVSDQDNDRIQKFSSTGTFITKWGSQGSGDGQIWNPKGIAVDSSGNVYVADSDNHRIQKFSKAALSENTINFDGWTGVEYFFADDQSQGEKGHNFVLSNGSFNPGTMMFDTEWSYDSGDGANGIGPVSISGSANDWAITANTHAGHPAYFHYDGTTLRMEWGAKYEGSGTYFLRVDFHAPSLPDDYGTISGKVSIQPEGDVTGTIVEIFDSLPSDSNLLDHNSATIPTPIKTYEVNDSSGNYSFNLSNGTYYIRARKPLILESEVPDDMQKDNAIGVFGGYEPTKVVVNNDSHTYIDITLESRDFARVINPSQANNYQYDFYYYSGNNYDRLDNTSIARLPAFSPTGDGNKDIFFNFHNRFVSNDNNDILLVFKLPIKADIRQDYILLNPIDSISSKLRKVGNYGDELFHYTENTINSASKELISAAIFGFDLPVSIIGWLVSLSLDAAKLKNDPLQFNLLYVRIKNPQIGTYSIPISQNKIEQGTSSPPESWDSSSLSASVTRIPSTDSEESTSIKQKWGEIGLVESVDPNNLLNLNRKWDKHFNPEYGFVYRDRVGLGGGETGHLNLYYDGKEDIPLKFMVTGPQGFRLSVEKNVVSNDTVYIGDLPKNSSDNTILSTLIGQLPSEELNAQDIPNIALPTLATGIFNVFQGKSILLEKILSGLFLSSAVKEIVKDYDVKYVWIPKAKKRLYSFILDNPINHPYSTNYIWMFSSPSKIPEQFTELPTVSSETPINSSLPVMVTGSGLITTPVTLIGEDDVKLEIPNETLVLSENRIFSSLIYPAKRHTGEPNTAPQQGLLISAIPGLYLNPIIYYFKAGNRFIDFSKDVTVSIYADKLGVSNPETFDWHIRVNNIKIDNYKFENNKMVITIPKPSSLPQNETNAPLVVSNVLYVNTDGKFTAPTTIIGSQGTEVHIPLNTLATSNDEPFNGYIYPPTYSVDDSVPKPSSGKACVDDSTIDIVTDNLKFDQEITIKIPMIQEKYEKLSDPKVYYFDASSASWKVAGDGGYYENGYMVVNVDHLSLFSVQSADNKPPAILSNSAPIYSTNTSPSTGFTVRWSATDPYSSGVSSGIDSYQIQRHNNTTTAWSTLKVDGNDWTTKTKTTFIGNPGYTYYFRVRAKDNAGNISAWSSVKYAIVPYDNNSLSYSSNWKNASSTYGYKKTLKYSSKKGAYAALGFKGKSVTLIAPKGSSRGKLDVYIRNKINGVWSKYSKIKTIDLYLSTGKSRVPFAIKSWSSSSIHQVKFVATGTKNSSSRGTRVDIDGVAIRR